MLTNALLSGSDKHDKVTNVGLLKSTITYLERPLIHQ